MCVKFLGTFYFLGEERERGGGGLGFEKEKREEEEVVRALYAEEGGREKSAALGLLLWAFYHLI
jgi:hypothetical protein